MAPEPTLLRTITTLLNYERLVSDPHYKRTSLHSSTIADQTILPRLEGNAFNKKRPASIQKINVHTFHHDTSTPDPAQDPAQETSSIPTTCTLHPSCDLATRSLSSTQLETIVYESRSHDGCYKALTPLLRILRFLFLRATTIHPHQKRSSSSHRPYSTLHYRIQIVRSQTPEFLFSEVGKWGRDICYRRRKREFSFYAWLS